MNEFQNLAPFWEPSERIVFPLSRESEFGAQAAAIHATVAEAAQASGKTGFEPETELVAAKRIAGLRLRMTAEVLGITHKQLAERIGVAPETFSTYLAGKSAPPYSVEQAAFRELLALAIREWVSTWYIDDTAHEFTEALREANAIPGADNFARALYAMGCVCGDGGWPDFWRYGKHIYPLPKYEHSAASLARQVAVAKRGGASQ